MDDILVNEDVVRADEVAAHLANYGLRCKEAEKVADGTKLLGLWVESSSNGSLRWKRGASVPEVGEVISRRDLFSICGQLIGHHPVAGWLRVACGYIKRSSEGHRWEDDIGKEARQMLLEVMQETEMADPVGGKWSVVSKKGRVWCDASSLAVGCALEVDDGIVEDGAWLRKADDGAHINMAELDSVLKGLTSPPNGDWKR